MLAFISPNPALRATFPPFPKRRSVELRSLSDSCLRARTWRGIPIRPGAVWGIRAAGRAHGCQAIGPAVLFVFVKPLGNRLLAAGRHVFGPYLRIELVMGPVGSPPLPWLLWHLTGCPSARGLEVQQAVKAAGPMSSQPPINPVVLHMWAASGNHQPRHQRRRYEHPRTRQS